METHEELGDTEGDEDDTEYDGGRYGTDGSTSGPG